MEELQDERLYKESLRDHSIGYGMMVVINLIMIGVNFLWGKENNGVLIVTLAVLVVPNLVIIIKSIMIKMNIITFIKGNDEGILEYRNKTFMYALITGLFIILVGQMIFMRVESGLSIKETLMTAIWVIPSLYVVFKGIKHKRLNVLNAKGRKIRKQNIYIRILRSSVIFFIITMAMNSDFSVKHIIAQIIGAIIFGVLFEVIFFNFMKINGDN